MSYALEKIIDLKIKLECELAGAIGDECSCDLAP